jgi:iron complex outermembrane receptor protein
MASTVVDPEDSPGLPANLTEIVVEVPGVSENGQGGLFQNVSIRGIARHRILHLVAGSRITTERRAGPTTSFLDPALIGSVDVLRGPASSYYGSGALGGVLQIYPHHFTGGSALAGYDTAGDQNVIAAGYGQETWSVGAARRQSDTAETPDGEELNTHFRQVSATLAGRWGKGPRRYQALWIPSLGEEIGKSNSDFPGRTTTYPRETHDLLRFLVEAESGWGVELYGHPHDLETEVVEAGAGQSNVFNESVDFGARWWDRREVGSGLVLRYGVETFGRRGVDAEEVRVSFDPNAPEPVQRIKSLDGAGESELAGFATLRGTWGPADWEMGTRFTWLEQENGDDPRAHDSAWSGFAGLSVPLPARFTLTGHLGTGLRFPTLTERFFSGTTGRGIVSGNRDLSPERSYSIDAGLKWVTESLFLGGAIYHNRIESYIERIETGLGRYTFDNLTSGTITGTEGQVQWNLGGNWTLGGGGHWLRGRDADDRPLADIPPAELWADLQRQRRRWELRVRYAYRAGKDDPGSDEKEIPAARLLTASVGLRPAPAWLLSIFATNLLDETWFVSADDKAAPAPGRAVGLQVRWTGG